MWAPLCKANQIFDKNRGCQEKKRRDDARRSKRRFARIGNSRRRRDDDNDDDDGDGKLRERDTVIQIRPPRRITITTCGSIVQQDLQRILQGISPTLSHLISSPVYK